MQAEQPLKRADWVKAIIVLPVVAVVGIVVPQQLFKDKDSPYRFTQQQVGPYGRGSDDGDENERSL